MKHHTCKVRADGGVDDTGCVPCTEFVTDYWAFRANDYLTQPAGLDEGLFTADVSFSPFSGLTEEKTP